MRYRAESQRGRKRGPLTCGHEHVSIAFAEECRVKHGLNEVRRADGTKLNAVEIAELLRYRQGKKDYRYQEKRHAH